MKYFTDTYKIFIFKSYLSFKLISIALKSKVMMYCQVTHSLPLRIVYQKCVILGRVKYRVSEAFYKAMDPQVSME